MLTRRAALLGLIAAPVIIRTPGLLMPVKSFNDDVLFEMGRAIRWEKEGPGIYKVFFMVGRDAHGKRVTEEHRVLV